MICHFCHKKIALTYYHIKSKNKDINICPHCNKSLPKCKECDMPIITAREKAVKLCMDCRKKLPKCGICDKAIFGKYEEYPDMYVCPTCMRKAPRCEMCEHPLGKENCSIIDNKKLCDDCADNMDYCVRCNKPLFGKFYNELGYSEKFCEKCVKIGNHCDLCGMPFRKESHNLYGLRVCTACVYLGILNNDSFLYKADEVASIIKRKFNIEIKFPIAIYQADAKYLKELHEKYKPIRDKDTFKFGIFVYEKRALIFYIGENLASSIFTYAFATTYILAWENKNFRSDIDILYLEGMAQWIAYHVLLEQKWNNVINNFMKHDEMFGAGFAEMQKLEEQYGTLGALKKIKAKFSI
jgi:hypothetical protein